MKTVLGILSLILIGFLMPLTVSASGFYLETIGSLDVQGSAYSQYWYSGSNPTLTGKAPSGSTVTVTIDGTSGTATTQADGTWSYPTTIAEGDHSITLSTDASNSYTFTLTIGEMAEGSGGTITAPETPPAGIGTPTIVLLCFGVLALALPLAIKKVIQT